MVYNDEKERCACPENPDETYEDFDTDEERC
jgi:hypothetical protein